MAYPVEDVGGGSGDAVNSTALLVLLWSRDEADAGERAEELGPRLRWPAGDAWHRGRRSDGARGHRASGWPGPVTGDRRGPFPCRIEAEASRWTWRSMARVLKMAGLRRNPGAMDAM